MRVSLLTYKFGRQYVKPVDIMEPLNNKYWGYMCDVRSRSPLPCTRLGVDLTMSYITFNCVNCA